jgi:hypothetical protein
MGFDQEAEHRNQLRFQMEAACLVIKLDKKKRAMPSTRIISLGFELDTERMKVSIPMEKLSKNTQRMWAQRAETERKCDEKGRKKDERREDGEREEREQKRLLIYS